MKIFFDTEFTGLHKNTTLISIGLIDENGKTFYAEFNDFDLSQCDTWITNNVLAYCKFINEKGSKFEIDEDGNYILKGDKNFIKLGLTKWFNNYGSVELVSDVCHYDMVLLIDIFGTAFNLPKNVNAACHDINQDIARYYKISEIEAFDYSREQILKNCDVNIEGDKHNSLYDAKVIKFIYDVIKQEGMIS